MSLDPRQEEVLNALRPPRDFPPGDGAWRTLIAESVIGTDFDDLSEQAREAWAYMVNEKALGAAILYGRSVAEVRAAANDPRGTNIENGDLFEHLEEALRPNLSALHADAHAALLRAIERMAIVEQDVFKLAALADAYMTLPAPGEDEV